MTRRLRVFLLLIAGGVFAVFFVVFRPQAEEVETHDDAPTVSDSELQLYIKVYSAMQENHDLTIDSAIAPFNISLDGFRQLERRIQAQPRLVERVRDALLEHAKAHSVFAQSSGTPAPQATPPKREHDAK